MIGYKVLIGFALCLLMLVCNGQATKTARAAFDTSEVCFECKTLEDARQFEAKKGGKQVEQEYARGSDDKELLSLRWDTSAGMFVKSVYQFNNGLSIEVVWSSCALDTNDNSYGEHYDISQCKNVNRTDFVNKYEAIKNYFKTLVKVGDMVMKSEVSRGDDIPVFLSYDLVSNSNIMASIKYDAKNDFEKTTPYLLRFSYSVLGVSDK